MILKCNSSSYCRGNNSSFNRNSDFYKKWDFILPIAIEVILINISLWILISLLRYGKKTGKWRNTGQNHSEKLSIGHIFTSVVFCAAGCIIHPVLGIAYMSIGFNGEDGLCEAFGDLMACAYGFAYLSLVMFFWLRQRVFFTNQMLSVKYSKPVRWFSAISIVIIYLAGGAIALFLIIPNNQKRGPNGCLYTLSTELQISSISSFAYVMFSDFSLMALFVYAIVRSGKPVSLKNECFNRMFCLCCSPSLTTKDKDDNETCSTSIASGCDDQGIVRKILTKTLVVTVATLVMDLIFQIYVFYVADQDSHRRFSILFGSVHLFFRFALVVLSLANFKKILSSICKG